MMFMPSRLACSEFCFLERSWVFSCPYPPSRLTRLTLCINSCWTNEHKPICTGFNLLCEQFLPLWGYGGDTTDEDTQEANCNREEICEREIKNTTHGVPPAERFKHTGKVSNQHLSSGSMPGSFCLLLILV